MEVKYVFIIIENVDVKYVREVLSVFMTDKNINVLTVKVVLSANTRE